MPQPYTQNIELANGSWLTYDVFDFPFLNPETRTKGKKNPETMVLTKHAISLSSTHTLHDLV